MVVGQKYGGLDLIEMFGASRRCSNVFADSFFFFVCLLSIVDCDGSSSAGFEVGMVP